MHSLNKRGTRYSYSLLNNPLPRILKFDKLYSNIQNMPCGGIVLDYGSGDCPYKELLLTKFNKYIAADYEITNRHHSKRPDVYIEDNGLNIPSASIDCVVITEVLEHIFEPKVVLRELHRILKPGGIIIGTVPFIVSEHEEPHDFYRYTYFCLKRLFEDIGFEIVRLDYVGDRIGAAITISNSVLQLTVILFRKLKLRFIAYLLNCIIKIPEYIYLILTNAGLTFQKINYLKALPVGFFFSLRK